LTAEKAKTVNVPCIPECFLNIECEFLWEHEHFEGSRGVTVVLRATHICMDSDYYDKNKLGRYGKTGYMSCLRKMALLYMVKQRTDSLMRKSLK